MTESLNKLRTRFVELIKLKKESLQNYWQKESSCNLEFKVRKLKQRPVPESSYNLKRKWIKLSTEWKFLYLKKKLVTEEL